MEVMELLCIKLDYEPLLCFIPQPLRKALCSYCRERLDHDLRARDRQRQRPPPPPRRRASTTPSKLVRNSQQSAFSVTETLDELRGIDGGVEVVVRIEVHYRGQ